MKKTISITIKISWLLFDVANETFLRGKALKNRDNHREIAAMYATEDPEVREKVLRSIRKGTADIRNALSEYIDAQGESWNNSLADGAGNVTINLSMPGNFDEAAISGIGESAHDYLKNVAIGDWYLVTNKDEAQQYYALSEKSLATMMTASSKRKRPIRPSIT